MAAKQFIIGIDPGVKTGFALLDALSGAWREAATTDFHALMAWADDVAPEDRGQYLIVVESAKQLAVYHKHRKHQETAVAQAQARSIGQNNREAELVIGELRRRGFEVVEFVPRSTWKQRAKKWTQDECRQITGYQARTNEHTRDAMRFAWEHRHLLRIK